MRRHDTGSTRVREPAPDAASAAPELAALQAVYDSAPIGLCVLDAAGRWVRINERLAEINGLPAAAHLGRRIRELLPDIADAAEALHRRIMETGEPAIGIEITGETPARPGVVRTWVEDWLPLRDAAGRVVAVNVAAREVTEERAAARALAESEARLRLAQAAAGIGIHDYDVAADRALWDPRIRQLWGVPDDLPITYAVFLAGVHPDDRARVEAALARAFDPAGDGSYAIEYRVVSRRDGRVRSVASSGLVTFRDGRPVRNVGTVLDVTARQAAEAARAESEARFRALAESHPGFIFETDADGANIYTNRQFQDYVGMTDAALLGDGWLAALHPDDRARAAAAWAEAVRTGAPYGIEYRFRAADGRYRWFLCRGLPQRGPDGRILRWHGAAVDITEIVAAREGAARQAVELEARVAERTRALTDAAQELRAEIRRREAAQAALLQAQKLEALGQLTGGVAHDFNNVLAAVTGSYALMRRRTDDPAILGLVELGEAALERAATLIGQLLSFARRGELKPEPLDLAPALVGAEALLRHAVGSAVDCAVAVPPGLWPVLADRHQLEVALLNLAVNARDAMPGGGRLTVAARNLPPAERPPHLPPGDYVAITVDDTGEGMTADLVERVVEPFFTTKPPGQGTGLGLAMVNGFAIQSGGALRIDSRPGAGTRVEIVLPRAALLEPAGTRTGGASPPEAALHAPATILLVEDDDQLRPVTAALLRELGYTVVEARNAEVAAVLLHTLDTLDLLVTDVTMPGADGPTLAARVREERPGLPVLFVTGRPPGPALSGEAVLRKPFRGDALAAAVLDLLGRRPSRAPADTADAHRP